MRPVSALFRAVLAAIIVFSSGTGFSARHAHAQVPSAAFGGAATAAAGSPASVEAAKLDPSGGVCAAGSLATRASSAAASVHGMPAVAWLSSCLT